MPVYFIANIRIYHPEEYQKYINQAAEVFKKYNGTYLCVDNEPEIVEGQWDYTRAVLIRFDSRDGFNAWYHSADYQNILIHRLQSARCDSLLIHSLPGS